MPRSRTRAKIASTKKFALYTPLAREKPRQVIEGTKENGRAYGKCASGGRFLSVDPVATDASTGSSFNRYSYANDSPYKYVDPDGREARTIEITCVGGCTTYGSLSRSSGAVGRQPSRDIIYAPAGPAPTEGVESICPECYLIGGGGAKKLLSNIATKSVVNGQIAVRFGVGENQISHALRHLKSAGVDESAAQTIIRSDLAKIAESLPRGQYNGSVVVNGAKVDYSAFKLPDGTINVGRITSQR